MDTSFVFIATQTLWDFILVSTMFYLLGYWIVFVLMVFDPTTEVHPENKSTGAKLIKYFHKKIHPPLDK